MPPAGWAITNAGIGDTSQAGHVKWIVILGATNTTYKYTAAVPCSATGANAFSGPYGFDNGIIIPPAGQAVVNVHSAPPPPRPSRIGYPAASAFLVPNPRQARVPALSGSRVIQDLSAATRLE